MGSRNAVVRSLTDEEILAQIPAARARGEETDRTEPRASDARYDRDTGRVWIELTNGCAFAFPADHAQGLRGASPRDLEGVRVDPFGAGLRWEALDVDLSVAGLLAGVFGGETWMREMAREGARTTGRRGGQARGGAKAKAARLNGARGGRPPVQVDASVLGDRMKVQANFGKERRKVTIELGREYVVQPLNPVAKRNLGRHVIVEGFTAENGGRVRVRFADTGRAGYEAPSNLVPLEKR
jgi:hypothetical protein